MKTVHDRPTRRDDGEMEDSGLSDALSRGLSGQEPRGLTPSFSTISEGSLYHAGTTVPMLNSRFFFAGPEGLIVPQRTQRSAPIDYFGVYVVLGDYLTGDGVGLSNEDVAQAVINLFCAQAPRLKLLETLVLLNRATADPALLKVAVETHQMVLAPDTSARFQNVMRQPNRVLVSRQAIFAGMSHVLSMPETEVVPTMPARYW